MGSRNRELQSTGRWVVTVVICIVALVYSRAYGYMYERNEDKGLEWQVSHENLAKIIPKGHDPKVYVNSDPDVSNWVIVTLKDGLDKKVVDKHIDWLTSNINSSISSSRKKGESPDIGLHCLYQSGYAGRLSSNMVKELEKRDEVLFVRKDRYVSLQKIDAITHINTIPGTHKSTMDIRDDSGDDSRNVYSTIIRSGMTTDYGPSWGLDRINQHLLPLDGIFSAPYPHGFGVDIYVLDSGVSLGHQEFEGRAKYGATFVTGHPEDVYGHGTHVSGIIAGRTVGVARKVNIISVKVMFDNGKGPVSSVIMGIDWAVRNAKVTRRPSIINMSIGTSSDDTLDYAVLSAVRQGILVVVSAGNEKADACEGSPSGLRSSFTVGATDPNDARAPYSNYGNCVKIYAPGSYIKSASNKANDAYKLLNGTSMAAPYVAGAAALYLSRFPRAQPYETMNGVIGAATQRLIRDPKYRSGYAPMLFITDGSPKFNIRPFSAPYSVTNSAKSYAEDHDDMENMIENDYKRITSKPRKVSASKPTTSSRNIYIIIGIYTIVAVLLHY